MKLLFSLLTILLSSSAYAGGGGAAGANQLFQCTPRIQIHLVQQHWITVILDGQNRGVLEVRNARTAEHITTGPYFDTKTNRRIGSFVYYWPPNRHQNPRVVLTVEKTNRQMTCTFIEQW